MLTKTITIATIMQMIGSSFSSITSSVIVFMVWKNSRRRTQDDDDEPQQQGGSEDLTRNSEKGSTTTYQRLIFGLSMSDIFQSFSFIVGPFIAPKGTFQSPWAVGTTGTCSFFGFLTFVGGLGVPLYTLALSTYFLLRIKYRKTNSQLVPFEKKMHFFIILYVTCVCFAALFTESYNTVPTGSYCQVASIPVGCRDNPGYDCQRGLYAFGFVVLWIVTTLVSLVGVVINMVLIGWYFIKRDKKSGGTFSSGTLRQNSMINREETSSRRASTTLFHLFREIQDNETEAQYLSRLYLSQLLLQAFLYVLAFILTFLFVWIVTCMYLTGKVVPEWMLYPLSVLYSFGGVLNVFVYARPKVRSLRMKRPNITWMHAFVLVVKAGGELPADDQQGQDRGARRNGGNVSNNEERRGCCSCFRNVFQVLAYDGVSEISDSHANFSHYDNGNVSLNHDSNEFEEEPESVQSNSDNPHKHFLVSSDPLLSIAEEDNDHSVIDPPSQDYLLPHVRGSSEE